MRRTRRVLFDALLDLDDKIEILIEVLLGLAEPLVTLAREELP